MTEGKSASEARQQPYVESRKERWLGNTRTVGGAILLAIFIRIVLFEAFEIEGPSMEPTLLNGDRVVVAKFLYGLFLPFTDQAVLTWGSPDPGDVVIVRSPADNIDIVKRVIGVAGDTVEIRKDVVYVNGDEVERVLLPTCGEHAEELRPDYHGARECFREELHGYQYRISHATAAPRESQPPVTVGDGEVFVLGDHRDRSNDSRNPHIGTVPVARVKGRSLFIYWSNADGPRWDRIFDDVE